MPTYYIEISGVQPVATNYTIEADSREEAEDIAIDFFNEDYDWPTDVMIESVDMMGDETDETDGE